jgi:hypothetical protein
MPEKTALASLILVSAGVVLIPATEAHARPPGSQACGPRDSISVSSPVPNKWMGSPTRKVTGPGPMTLSISVSTWRQRSPPARPIKPRTTCPRGARAGCNGATGVSDTASRTATSTSVAGMCSRAMGRPRARDQQKRAPTTVCTDVLPSTRTRHITRAAVWLCVALLAAACTHHNARTASPTVPTRSPTSAARPELRDPQDDLPPGFAGSLAQAIRGTGPAVLRLTEVASTSKGVVVRLVCDSGEFKLKDQNGERFVSGFCDRTVITGGDLPRDRGKLPVTFDLAIGPNTRWSVAIYLR